MSAEPSQGRGNTGNPQNVTSDFSSNFKYIYDIPQMEKKRLADLLDQDARWVGLALRQMGYSADDVEVSLGIPDEMRHASVFRFPYL